MEKVDWGSIPDWFAAVGTVGALIVALALLRKEIRDRRRTEAIANLRPADGIFAWVEPRTDAGGWETFVLNHSKEPVYNVVVRFTPYTDPPLPVEEALWGTVAPGPPKPGIKYPDRPGDIFGIPEVEVEFTDGLGRHWLRNALGQLQQLQMRMPFD